MFAKQVVVMDVYRSQTDSVGAELASEFRGGDQGIDL